MKENSPDIAVGTAAEVELIQNHLFQECELLIPIPYHDWRQFVRSKEWMNLCKYLEEVQTPDMRTFHPGRPVVVEKIVYKNPVSELGRAFCAWMKKLGKVLFHRNIERH